MQRWRAACNTGFCELRDLADREPAVKRLLIVGAGGLGSEALWVAQLMKEWECVGFADDRHSGDRLIHGMRFLGSITEAKRFTPPFWVHCAIGDDQVRKRVIEDFAICGWKLATLIHPSVIVAPSATIGDGCYIAAGSILCPNTTLGTGVLVNNHVSVGHDSAVGAFSQLCPGVRVSGNCTLGELVFMGSNAVVSQGIKVGDGAAIGASSFANRDVADGQTVVGVPARSRQATRTVI